MVAIIAVGDLDAVGVTVDPVLADLIVDGANAQATRVAPCLAESGATAEQLAEAKLVLLGAAQRWASSGAQALSQQQAGPFAVMTDTRTSRGYSLWPSEISQLQDICRGDLKEKAFSVDTAPSLSGMHADWCSLNFDATYCSCGADLTGSYPLYG